MNNGYGQLLLTQASALDDAINSKGVITQYVTSIVQNNDDKAAIKICSILGKIAELGDSSKTSKAKDLKDSLIRFYGYKQLSFICNSEKETEQEEKTLEQLWNELNHLVGLEKVKSKVSDLVAFQRIQHLRRQMGLSSPKSTLHLAFIGNPGTGKTTVARIVGRIYKQIGLLSKGHFIEVSRTDLIAGYQGQTALKVKDVIERSKGGVLFIDEAYSITENDHSDSYGRECLTELTKALEDYRDDLVVIVAGYTEPMCKFFESNPGLKSRFNTFIEFDDYDSEELLSIFEKMCIKEDYTILPSAKHILIEALNHIVDSKDDQFANGRLIRNIFEEMMMNHARRVAKLSNPSMEELKEFVDVDLPLCVLSEKDI